MVMIHQEEAGRALEARFNYLKGRKRVQHDAPSGFIDSMRLFAGNLTAFSGRHREFCADVARFVDGEDVGRIVDFCCGPGGNTAHLAEYFPKAKIVGLEYSKGLVKFANSRHAGAQVVFGRCNLFKEVPMPSYDMAVFHRACGLLTDVVIDAAVGSGARYIVGVPCCHTMIPPVKYKSQNQFLNLLTSLTDVLGGAHHDCHEERIKGRYRSESLSAAAQQYGMSLADLMAIATFTEDSRAAREVVDLNRMLRLGERGYESVYDTRKGTLLAVRR